MTYALCLYVERSVLDPSENGKRMLLRAEVKGMKIEVGKTYYSQDVDGKTFVEVIAAWEGGSFKVRCSADRWGCRLMTADEIRRSYPSEQRQEVFGQGAGGMRA